MVTGRNGLDLHEVWAGDARAYLGITTPDFPQLFHDLRAEHQPRGQRLDHLLLRVCAVRYIIGCLELLAQTGARSLEVRRDVHDAFNEDVDATNAMMAWGAPQVSSWYKNETGRVSQGNWPYRLVDYWTATLKPSPADFILEGAAQPT